MTIIILVITGKIIRADDCPDNKYQLDKAILQYILYSAQKIKKV